MKKNNFKLAALALSGAMALFSCNPGEDVTPDPTKPSVDVKFVGSQFGVQGNYNVKTEVSTTGDTAYINITVDGTEETGAIYVLYQKDDEKAVKWQKQPNGGSFPSAGYKGTSLDGTTKNNFNYAGSDFTFNVPSNINKAWKLTIPVALRKEASSKADVFTLWITKNGKSGRFDNPTQNLAYGVAVVTLNYTNGKLINNYEATLGGANNNLGSLFSTKTGGSYKRSYAQDSLDAGSTKYTDFAFNDFTANKYVIGSFFTSAGAEDADVKSGFGAVSNITRVLKIKDVGTNFETITNDSDLDAAVTGAGPTANKVIATTDPTGKVYAFITADGKKGLIKILSASNLSTATAELKIQVKVQR